jgi:hypothetical protein
MGAMTSLKQALQRDELISSGPQEISEPFSHSLPHLTHFTRSVLIPYTVSSSLSCRSRISAGTIPLYQWVASLIGLLPNNQGLSFFQGDETVLGTTP